MGVENDFDHELDAARDTADFDATEDLDFNDLDTLEADNKALEGGEELTSEDTSETEGDLTDGEEQPADDETETAELFDGNDDVLVSLDDGEQLSLSELKKGYFRDKDYRHKTEEIAEDRKDLEVRKGKFNDEVRQIQSVQQNLVGYLQSLIPPEPDLSLAETNPGEYQLQRAMREQAIAEVNGVLNLQQQTNQTVEQVSADDLTAYRSGEEAKLLEAMPELKEPGRKAAFDAANQKTALEFGFSEKEIESTADERILRLVHYARIGKTAEQNRKNARRRQAEKARKGTRAQAAPKGDKLASASRAYRQTGSLSDAEALVDAAYIE